MQRLDLWIAEIGRSQPLGKFLLTQLPASTSPTSFETITTERVTSSSSFVTITVIRPYFLKLPTKPGKHITAMAVTVCMDRTVHSTSQNALTKLATTAP